MSISVNPLLPVIAAQGAAPDIVLQPGSVVDAQVLKILSNNLVRIAIADSLDRCALGSSAACRSDPAACGIADARRHQARGGRGRALRPACRRLRRHRNARAGCDRRCRGRFAGYSGAAPECADAAARRVAVSAAAETRGDAAGEPGALVCQSRCRRRVEWPAAAGAAGCHAGAGAADQPRSRPDRQRHQEGVPEIRAVSRGVAGAGSAPPAGGVPDLKAALIVLRQTLVSSLGDGGSCSKPGHAGYGRAAGHRAGGSRYSRPPIQ